MTRRDKKDEKSKSRKTIRRQKHDNSKQDTEMEQKKKEDPNL